MIPCCGAYLRILHLRLQKVSENSNGAFQLDISASSYHYFELPMSSSTSLLDARLSVVILDKSLLKMSYEPGLLQETECEAAPFATEQIEILTPTSAYVTLSLRCTQTPDSRSSVSLPADERTTRVIYSNAAHP
jgi:hypothetical protein